MPSVYDLKPRFQALLRPLIAGLRRAGVTPNGVTIAALLGSLAVGFSLVAANDRPMLLLALPIWLLLRMALNAIDGMMAREYQLATPLGGMLNEVGDVLSDVFLYLPLAVLHEPSRWPIVAFVLGAMLTEFCGVLGPAMGSARQYQGPMGKSDRAFWVGALALVTVFFPNAQSIWPWFFGIAAALTGITSITRCRVALAPSKEDS